MEPSTSIISLCKLVFIMVSYDILGIAASHSFIITSLIREVEPLKVLGICTNCNGF